MLFTNIFFSLSCDDLIFSHEFVLVQWTLILISILKEVYSDKNCTRFSTKSFSKRFQKISDNCDQNQTWCFRNKILKNIDTRTNVHQSEKTCVQNQIITWSMKKEISESLNSTTLLTVVFEYYSVEYLLYSNTVVLEYMYQ